MNGISQKSKWFSRQVFIWSLFDFANSSFATIIAAFVYPVYFREVVAMNAPASDFYWSTGINISMIIVAFLSPVLGAAADYYRCKKKYLLVFTALCISSTALLYFVQSGMIAFGLALFILANIGFQAGLGFYDAFIKEISSVENYNKVSSLGYGVGYLGSLSSLAAVFLFKDEPRLTFVICGVIFLLFSLPMFIFVKEKRNSELKNREGLNFLKVGLKRTADTLKHIKSYTNLKRFLLAYFLYIDGVNTIIFFSAIYAKTTLGFSIIELVQFFVIVQITALAGSFLFGYIADKFGTKRTIIYILIGWSILTLAVFFSHDKTTFLIIGAFAGLFLGSSQALSRSFMSNLTPDEKKTEFFGFYSLFEKTSTILGPLAFGLVSWLSGSQRYAVLSILAFFVAGLLLLKRVKAEDIKTSNV
ncbi:MAG: MFS transporter [Ignavibacteria bacterium]